MVVVNKDSTTIEPTNDNIKMFTEHVMKKNNISIPYTYAGIAYISKDEFPVYLFFDNEEMKFIRRLTEEVLLSKSNFKRLDLHDSFIKNMEGKNGDTN